LEAVRKKMVALQRQMGKDGGVILDGRDIGTVVFPDADIKFFLLATPEERAKRRCNELRQKGIPADFATVLKEMTERDAQDSTRALAPLKPAADAIVIDTTNLTIEQQAEQLYQYIKAKLAEDNN